ncbi:uncharacterized protein [Triticum aestivum]|uniref:uncharacterized protein isoform X2 n=1 Tax=Triticum aestivum TaxID=4565 RepID=UPI001D035D09|nr:uncharacterized protein LOC123110756 isoform X2 [Triticum aestivum]
MAEIVHQLCQRYNDVGSLPPHPQAPCRRPPYPRPATWASDRRLAAHCRSMHWMGWCSTPPCPQNVPMDDILQINKFICAAALTMSRGIGVGKMKVLSGCCKRCEAGRWRRMHGPQFSSSSMQMDD